MLYLAAYTDNVSGDIVGICGVVKFFEAGVHCHDPHVVNDMGIMAMKF